MEDRIGTASLKRPGVAMIALAAMIAISGMWCWLALWPAGAGDAQWIVQARAACFGAAPGGLPDTGGWILLVGEPAGMVVAFVAIWGRSLRADVVRLRANPVWRWAATGLGAAMIVGAVVLGVRISRAYAAMRAPIAEGVGGARLDAAAPNFVLFDQHGRRVSSDDLRGRPQLVTFAFGHCASVCPTIVRDLVFARQSARRTDVGLMVVTLDPWRDTPDRLATIAAHWNLGEGDRVLSGPERDVNATLDAFGIGRRRNEVTGDIEHGSTVLLVDESGRVSWRLEGGWGRVGDLLLRR